MAIYGYARVSTAKQSIERQIRNILQANPDAIIYQEAYTGRKIEGRKEFTKLLSIVRAGDTIIFDSVSRMSRNAEDGYMLYMELYGKGVDLQFIKEPQINTSTYKAAAEKRLSGADLHTGKDSFDNLLSSIMDAINAFIADLAKEQIRLAFSVSQKEVDDLAQRTKEGMKTAALAGHKAGRTEGIQGSQKKKAEPAKAKIKALSKTFGGQLSDGELLQLLGIARNTYYKYKRELIEEQA